MLKWQNYNISPEKMTNFWKKFSCFSPVDERLRGVQEDGGRGELLQSRPAAAAGPSGAEDVRFRLLRQQMEQQQADEVRPWPALLEGPNRAARRFPATGNRRKKSAGWHDDDEEHRSADDWRHSRDSQVNENLEEKRYFNKG